MTDLDLLIHNVRYYLEAHPDEAEASLSRRAGLNEKYVTQLFHRRTGSPGIESLRKLAGAIGVTVQQLTETDLSQGAASLLAQGPASGETVYDRNERALLAVWRELNPTDQGTIFGFATRLRDAARALKSVPPPDRKRDDDPAA